MCGIEISNFYDKNKNLDCDNCDQKEFDFDLQGFKILLQKFNIGGNTNIY